MTTKKKCQEINDRTCLDGRYYAISLFTAVVELLVSLFLSFMKITQEVVDVDNTYNLGHFISRSFGAH